MTLLATNKTKPTRGRRNAVFDGQLWPGAVVPFSIAPVFNGRFASTNYSHLTASNYACTEAEKRVIFQAMKHWEDYTCIRFREETKDDKFAMKFITGSSQT